MKNSTKLILISILSCTLFTFSACRKISHYKYTGKIISVGTDCNDTYIIEVDQNINGANNNYKTFYAEQLPDDFKMMGLKIKFNCRTSEASELSPCTTMGITYPHITITEVEER